MPLRAIDFHVHLPTPDWLDGSMAGYVEAAEAYFRSSVSRQSLEQLADDPQYWPIAPERCLSELDALDLPDPVMRAVLHDNAARVLRL